MGKVFFDKHSCDKKSPKKWSALDKHWKHPLSDDTQDATQFADTIQKSIEEIIIVDSADVEVVTTDTKIAVHLQAAIQAAIALIIKVSIADSSTADKLTQELLQASHIKQVNLQHTRIENSRGVRVTTTDTDIAANIQLLLQVLLALVVSLDIL